MFHCSFQSRACIPWLEISEITLIHLFLLIHEFCMHSIIKIKSALLEIKRNQSTRKINCTAFKVR